ncbi:hypothetical protein FOXB_09796 [Fusarium oxysporum f. sp. conglutinans Fo5176]|uniref:Uncharacterized protein n=2 Tax=Fusarium oxysporum f. sp. conglutinans TaxID=100902 RepID=F9FTR5_FUSOF|nr:hypothetical protein FOXB_09796 [Fusarium oxysporum f. sp. conglutinans Fo5176]
MVRSVEHHGTDSMAMRKPGGPCKTLPESSIMDDQGQGNACQLYIPRICSPIFLRLECHGDISSVVSFDIARPSLTRVSSNRADPSRPSSLPIQIVDGPHGYPIDIRLFRAQDYKDDINRDHALMYDIILLDTFS